jgi:hypothetical protein
MGDLAVDAWYDELNVLVWGRFSCGWLIYIMYK